MLSEETGEETPTDTIDEPVAPKTVLPDIVEQLKLKVKKYEKIYRFHDKK